MKEDYSPHNGNGLNPCPSLNQLGRIHPKCENASKRRHSALIVPNADRVVDTRKKDFAVSNAAGARDRDDGLYDAVHHLIAQDKLKLDFWQEIDGVLASAIDLSMSLLPSVTAHFENRHALNTDFE